MVRAFLYILASIFAITFIRSIGLFGSTFLLPLYLERVMHLPESRIGVLLLPGALYLALFFLPIIETVSGSHVLRDNFALLLLMAVVAVGLRALRTRSPSSVRRRARSTFAKNPLIRSSPPTSSRISKPVRTIPIGAASRSKRPSSASTARSIPI